MDWNTRLSTGWRPSVRSAKVLSEGKPRKGDVKKESQMLMAEEAKGFLQVGKSSQERHLLSVAGNRDLS